ncbi:MAG: hypothetical protein HN576_01790 [Bacteriovoracaceae bacterium]|nr:hypothetical protein [Bacteriovoracaceae bacterium]
MKYKYYLVISLFLLSLTDIGISKTVITNNRRGYALKECKKTNCLVLVTWKEGSYKLKRHKNLKSEDKIIFTFFDIPALKEKKHLNMLFLMDFDYPERSTYNVPNQTNSTVLYPGEFRYFMGRESDDSIDTNIIVKGSTTNKPGCLKNYELLIWQSDKPKDNLLPLFKAKEVCRKDYPKLALAGWLDDDMTADFLLYQKTKDKIYYTLYLSTLGKIIKTAFPFNKSIFNNKPKKKEAIYNSTILTLNKSLQISSLELSTDGKYVIANQGKDHLTSKGNVVLIDVDKRKKHKRLGDKNCNGPAVFTSKKDFIIICENKLQQGNVDKKKLITLEDKLDKVISLKSLSDNRIMIFFEDQDEMRSMNIYNLNKKKYHFDKSPYNVMNEISEIVVPYNFKDSFYILPQGDEYPVLYNPLKNLKIKQFKYNSSPNCSVVSNRSGNSLIQHLPQNKGINFLYSSKKKSKHLPVSLPFKGGPATQLALSSDEKTLALGFEFQTSIFLIDLKTGKLLKEVKHDLDYPEYFWAGSNCASGNKLLYSKDQKTFIFGTKTGKVVFQDIP